VDLLDPEVVHGFIHFRVQVRCTVYALWHQTWEQYSAEAEIKAIIGDQQI